MRPFPAAGTRLPQDVSRGEEGDVDGEIPGVEEGHPAQNKGRQPEGRRGDVPQGTPPRSDASAPAAAVQVEGQSHSQEGEGHRQDVGVQVAQDVREGGELVNDFLRRAAQGVILQDAGGAPPPPETRRPPGGRPLRRVDQVADVQPGPESGSTVGTPEEAAGVENFEEGFEVAGEEEEEGGEEGS